MKCPSCGTINSQYASFCKECGVSLEHKEAAKTHTHTPSHSTTNPTTTSAQKVGGGVYRLIKALFYIFYVIMIILVPAVVWVASENRVCQPDTYNSYGQITLGQCTNTASGLVEFGHAFVAFGITWFALEIMKSIGIYISHGTKFKDQNTFFMQAMHENHKKKGAS